ncbi:MAG: hypothetical protein H7X89_02965 [Rhizobiales bacterium]|nr:hypothetical protein [Hyphomicrobiales bacterium]
MTRPLLLMLYGPLIWFVHFSFIYGAAGFGGAFGFSPMGIRLFCWSATLLACAALTAILWLAHGNRASMPEIARTLAALSLVAVLLQALVLWIVPF